MDFERVLVVECGSEEGELRVLKPSSYSEEASAVRLKDSESKHESG